MPRSQLGRGSTSSTERSGLDLTVHGSTAPRARRPNTLPIDRMMELNLDDGCTLSSGRTSSRTTSNPDLALELSYVSDSCHNRSSSSSYDESEWCAQTRKESKKTNTPKYSSPYKRISLVSNERSRSSIMNPIGSTDSGHSECSCSIYCTNNRQSRTDLIEVYVETVNNAQLTRFFRPCLDCGQPCCQCPSNHKCTFRGCSTCSGGLCECSPKPLFTCGSCGLTYCECPVRPMLSCMNCERMPSQSYDTSRTQNQLGNSLFLSDDTKTPQRNFTEHNPNNTLLQIAPNKPKRVVGNNLPNVKEKNLSQKPKIDSRRSSLRLNTPEETLWQQHSSEESHRNNAEQNADSGNSTLQLGDSSRREGNGILSRQHVSLSVMQLATAAQCARILADSLESVLQLAREELSDSGSSSNAVEDTTTHADILRSALNKLNNESSNSSKQ